MPAGGVITTFGVLYAGHTMCRARSATDALDIQALDPPPACRLPTAPAFTPP
jgi:hypothetical protein